MTTKVLNTIIIFLFAGTLLYGSTTVDDVETNLMCTCGCSMALYTCQCGTAGDMRSEIKSMINKGMDKDAILASFVDRYGERILSAPTKDGFNLMAWVTPFLAIGVIGGLLYKTVKRWSNTKEKTPNVSNEVKSEYSQKLMNELENFNEGDYS
jgi:cytochrome c-type biogenesis protein CcmH